MKSSQVKKRPIACPGWKWCGSTDTGSRQKPPPPQKALQNTAQRIPAPLPAAGQKPLLPAPPPQALPRGAATPPEISGCFCAGNFPVRAPPPLSQNPARIFPPVSD
ncbi:hypothetical protein FYJ76_16820 [Ruthenibacterium lactatiformans]|uniref:Uncharacterized protein n=1 Tax=Ruthenibacterium lactatiformans TaxID=1550024 RepID=A0A6I2UEZ2_9FIRM|nr:hypothetical protein [Ruthenibacterium lactatiformans]